MVTEPTTRREDLLTCLFGVWLVVGIFIDAYNHVTNPSLETFWTPWHAIFYAGFTASALWIVRIVAKRAQPTGNALDWAPPGYRLALFGLAIFAAGGIGDAIWHSVFGVETSIDALLSPTHLMLWIGFLLFMTAPARGAWQRTLHDGRPTYREFLPVTMSAGLGISGVAFFFIYGWSLQDTWMIRERFLPGISNEVPVAYGVLGIVLQSFILFAPLLVMRRRWHLPFGVATTIFTFTAVAMALGFDGELVGVPATIAGGLAFDLTVHRHPRVAAVAGPLVLFSTFFLSVGFTHEGLGWPPELWSGAIVLSVMMSLAVDMLLKAAASTREDAPSLASS